MMIILHLGASYFHSQANYKALQVVLGTRLYIGAIIPDLVVFKEIHWLKAVGYIVCNPTIMFQTV